MDYNVFRKWIIPDLMSSANTHTRTFRSTSKLCLGAPASTKPIAIITIDHVLRFLVRFVMFVSISILSVRLVFFFYRFQFQPMQESDLNRNPQIPIETRMVKNNQTSVLWFKIRICIQLTNLLPFIATRHGTFCELRLRVCGFRSPVQDLPARSVIMNKTGKCENTKTNRLTEV